MVWVLRDLGAVQVEGLGLAEELRLAALEQVGLVWEDLD